MRIEVGHRFGRLRVMSRVGTNQSRRSLWKCVCDCGGSVIANQHALAIGDRVSCGCRQKETRFSTENRLRHGRALTNVTDITYTSWRGIKSRCTNPNAKGYHNYGGRGITICKRWRSFENFLKDMGDRPSRKHSLDRKNNSKGYFKANCQWSTRDEQAANKRTVPVLRFRGKNAPRPTWAKEFGIKLPTLNSRLARGWSVKRALTTPLKPRLVKAWETRRTK